MMVRRERKKWRNLSRLIHIYAFQTQAKKPQRFQESWKIEREDDGSKRKRKWRNLPGLIRIYAFKKAKESKEMMVRKERENGEISLD